MANGFGKRPPAPRAFSPAARPLAGDSINARQPSEPARKVPPWLVNDTRPMVGRKLTKRPSASIRSL